MTLCTGALCNLGNTKAVVAFDTMASTNIAQAENAFKFENLGKRWIALIAGRISEARELAGVYRQHLKPIEYDLKEDNALEELRKPAQQYLDRVRNSLAQRLTGFDYEAFLRESHLFPEATRWAIFNMEPPEIELLFVGCIVDKYSGEPRIRLFKYAFGEVWAPDNFVAIGSGTTIAESTLMQRKVDETWTIPRAVYAVYEAQRMGSIAPGVGSKMRMLVFSYSSDLSGLATGMPNTKVWKPAMEGLYDRFGPREITNDFALPQDTFFE